MSDGLLSAFPINRSGAIQWRLPGTVTKLDSVVRVVTSAFKRARPKSHKRALPPSSISTFCWMITLCEIRTVDNRKYPAVPLWDHHAQCFGSEDRPFPRIHRKANHSSQICYKHADKSERTIFKRSQYWLFRIYILALPFFMSGATIKGMSSKSFAPRNSARYFRLL